MFLSVSRVSLIHILNIYLFCVFTVLRLENLFAFETPEMFNSLLHLLTTNSRKTPLTETIIDLIGIQ